MKSDWDLMTSSQTIFVPKWTSVFAKMLVSFFAFIILLLSITPWRQTSKGAGAVIALNPNDRVQNINATVSGRINQWMVRDGSKVKKGDPIVEINDIDPRFLERLKIERNAIRQKYEASVIAAQTAELNFKRQEELLNKGIASELKYEKAKINFKKLLAEESQAAASLAKAEIQLSRQNNQVLVAPRTGTILRTLHGSGSVFVKKGDTLATFVPETSQLAAEVYIDGNDLPLVAPGRKVRLQFEGWPAIQFSGWPSIAVGTFGGEVSIVDPSASKGGKFRVIITPDKDEKWPDATYLRQGTRLYAWILLDTVKLGYEMWRRFNGFPASLTSDPDDSIDTAVLKVKK